MTRMTVSHWCWLVPVLALTATACSGTPPITNCEAAASIEPDCRFQNPEDLVVSPAGGHLLVSQMGSMDGSRAGSLVSYDPQSGSIEALFPRRGVALAERADGWGDPACTPPDPQTFAPHGIDLETIEGGRHALYVINHGGRESVEMFEIAEPQGIPELTWRGCVVAPEEGYFNDLVILRDGGFWVSHMFPREANVMWTLLRMQILGHRPGHAYAWQPHSGFTKIPGSDVKFGNGVEKSADERVLFLNSYFGDAVIALDVASGERLASVDVASPDNLAWAPTGELLVASHHGSIADTLACQNIEAGSCGFRFQVVAIDPDDWSQRVLLDHEGPPMGAATVAVPLGDHVFLGTFAGDRMARVSATILER
jgi:hypothetical protein